MKNYYSQNPNYKTGVKILTDAQMRTGLPLYDTLLNKIERIREESTLVDRSMLLKQSFENLKYDQIFSILGGRGAGKTSVLMTLRHTLEQKKYNVILPIIMPELIEDDESIVSWIISAMKENLEQIETTLFKFGNRNNSDEYHDFCKNHKLIERCAFNYQNQLRQLLNELSNAYYATEFRTHHSTVDYATYKELMANGVESSYSLTKKFTAYWNELSEVYSKYIQENYAASHNSDENKPPLIFIFIDDADLKPQILNELLFVIPKYLSHPNVVVFVSASQKTLAYSVKDFMYKSITQNNFDLPALMSIEHQYNGESILKGEGKTVKFHDLRYGREYDKIKKLADEILRKIFPIYNRFYLKKYDRYQDKGLLQMFVNDHPNCDQTVKLSKKLTQELKRFKEEIYNLHIKSKLFENKNNIEVLETKLKSLKLISDDYESLENEMYFSFLGRYSRDIASVYYSLTDTFTAMSNLLEKHYKITKEPILNEISEEFIERMYDIVTKFITAAVDSNRNLTMFSRSVRDLVKTRLLHWQLYVDYAKILDIFKEERYLQENAKNIEPFVEMFCLLNFVEQLIVLVIPQRKTTHGYEEFPQLMQLCGIEIINYKQYIKERDFDGMLNQFYAFYKFDIIPEFDIHRIEHRKCFIRSVESLNLIRERVLKDSKLLTKNYIRSPKWYNLLITCFIMTYSILAIIPEYKSELSILTETLPFLDNTYYDLRKNYIYNLEKVFTTNMFEEISQEFDIQQEIINQDMERFIIKLKSAIDSLFLKYNHSDLEASRVTIFGTLISHADYLDHDLAIAAQNLIAKFAISEPFRRNDLLTELDYIEKIAKNSDDISAQSWFNDFKDSLKNQFLIYTKDQSYVEYKTACKAVNDVYLSYICYYAILIRKAFESNGSKEFKSMVKKCSIIRKNLPEIYDALQYKEWCRILEME